MKRRGAFPCATSPASTPRSAASLQRSAPPAPLEATPQPPSPNGASPPAVNKALYARIEKQIRTELTDALDTKKYPKLESYHRVHEAKKKAIEALRKVEAIVSVRLVELGEL